METLFQQENAMDAEKEHVKNMIAKYGFRWYAIVFNTEEDCITAEDRRYEEEKREEQLERIIEQQIQEANAKRDRDNNGLSNACDIDPWDIDDYYY